MVDYFISQVTKFIITNRKRIILTLIFLPVIIYGFVIFNTYAILSVDLKLPATLQNNRGSNKHTHSDTGSTNDPRIYVNANAGKIELGSPGIYIIPRNSKSIIAQAGSNIRTTSVLDIPWYGLVAKKIDLRGDKGADKLAYRSTLNNPCTSYSQKSNTTLMYDCKNPKSLLKYDTPVNKPWGTQAITNDLYYPNYEPIPYRGGIIGISYYLTSDVNTPGLITFVDENGKAHHYQHPEGIELEDLNKTRIFTDQNDQSNSRFVLVSSNGIIYLGQPSTNETESFIDFREITPPSDYNPSVQHTLCSIHNENVTCYRGLLPNLGDSTVETDKVTPQIVKLRFGDQNTQTQQVNDKSVMQEFATTSDGQIYGLNHKRLVLLRDKNSTYYPYELSQNVDHIAANKNLHFLQDGGVFTIDPNTHDSHQRFYSFNIRPDKLYVAGESIIILGKSANNNTFTFAWKLNETFTTNYGNRLIDILPTFPSSPSVSRADLVGSTIYIESTADRSSAPGSVLRKKEETLEYLRALGVDVDTLTIANMTD